MNGMPADVQQELHLHKGVIIFCLVDLGRFHIAKYHQLSPVLIEFDNIHMDHHKSIFHILT